MAKRFMVEGNNSPLEKEKKRIKVAGQEIEADLVKLHALAPDALKFHTLPVFESIKEHLHQCAMDISEQQIAQMIGISPGLYEYSYIKKEQRWHLIIKQTGSMAQEERLQTFLKSCNATTNMAIDRILKGAKKSLSESSDEWIKLQMEDFSVPEVTLTRSRTSSDEEKVLNIHKERYNENKRKMEHISAEAQKKLDTIPIPASLKALPAELIKKIRQQEYIKSLKKSRGQKGEEIAMISKLPTLCAQVEGFAKFRRKSAFLLKDLKKGLRQAPFKDKLEEHLELLVKNVPQWASIQKCGKDRLLRIDNKMKYSEALAQLRNLV